MCSTCDCEPDAPKNSETRAGAEVSAGLKTCRRCGSEPYIVMDKIHVECKSCFLESCNKKLRSTIGKSKLMNNNDPILIAHSGGASSTVLMDLIKNSIEFNFRREQKFRPSILHVDMRSIYEPDLDTNQRLSGLNALLAETKNRYPQWPVYWTTIEMISREPDCDTKRPFYLRYERDLNEASDLFDTQAVNCLRTALLNLDLTDQQHHLSESVNDLIAQVAESINKSVDHNDQLRCIFNASSATQLANNLMVDVILGRGATCHSTVSVCDKRRQIPIVRPMRDFSKKEIAFYLRARGLCNSFKINLATLSDCKSSVQKLTESFLSRLSADYPSTYSTLLRTGNKLKDS